MIVTERFNTEKTSILPNKRTDGIPQNIYKFEDATYCREIYGTGIYLQTDLNGDCWFQTTTNKLDVAPEEQDINQLVEIADSLNFDVENKSFRDIHKFINEDESKAEIKSGFYTIDMTTRPQLTCDIEFAAYCKYFYDFVNDNAFVSPQIIVTS